MHSGPSLRTLFTKVETAVAVIFSGPASGLV